MPRNRLESPDNELEETTESTPPDLPCTICDGTHQPNPRLCEECQPWDDLTHILLCKFSEYLRLDAFSFSTAGNSRRPWAFRGATDDNTEFDSTHDLQYHTLDYFVSRSQCIVCQVIGDLGRKFAEQSRAEPSPELGIWRPFLLEHAANVYKKQGPEARQSPNTSLKEICLVPGIFRAGGDDIPIVFKVVLSYEQFGLGLREVQIWDPGSISLSGLNLWLHSCRENHGEECNHLVVPMAPPPGLRLMDTSSNSIVLCGPEQVNYVALSYCWGAPSPDHNLQLLRENVAELSKENGLDVTKLPPVIVDAIQFCKDLGRQYLWIDQLCIIQDDGPSKLDQINAMDRIYHMADFTIVALSSTPPRLPGVSSRPRETDSAAFLLQLWDGSFVSPSGSADGPSSNWVIRRSRWETRGWTFQERKLSRRLVFIDDMHAFFSCHEGVQWEHDPRVQGPRWDLTAHDREASLHIPPVFSSYVNHFVIPYSMRQLSFRTDILNAFAGVGNILSLKMESPLLFGLLEAYLTQSLLWRSDDFSSRDADLIGKVPSWSWTAWDGTVDYGFARTAKTQRTSSYESALKSFLSSSSYDFGSLVSFYYSDPDTGVRPVQERGWSWFSLHYMDDGEFMDYLADETGDLQDPMWATRNERARTWRRCCHNPWTSIEYEEVTDDAHSKAKSLPGSLVFTTTCALLTLRERKAEVDAGSLPPVVCFDMVGDNGLFVGQTMLINREWTQRTLDLSQKYTVIVIGAAQTNAVEEYTIPRWKKLNTPGAPWGLYVLITDRKDGVHYRLAVGVADLIAWTSLNPTWESVVLA